MRYRRIVKFALYISLILVGMACTWLQPTPDDAAPGRVLFEDGFSDPESGWSRATAPGGETDYADGMYRILVNLPNNDIWAKSGWDLRDVSIEVKALKVGGGRNNRFGVICRAVDVSNFYTFIISSDGFYGIGKVKGASYELVGMDSLQPSEAIRQGSAINTIRADCWGEALTLYVNGELLAEARDGELASGDVGLIVGAYDEPGVDIRFDDFVLRAP